MRYVTIAPGAVQVEDGPMPATSPGRALLRVVASGVCRTDLELFHGCPLPNGCDYPVRPGHETAGIIEELGPEVDPELGLEAGQLVVVHPILNCGTCNACLSGGDSLCRRGRVVGMEEPGGMAQFMTWPADRLVRVDGVDPAEAAILADAVATSYHALCRAELAKGGRLCVLGAGGLGTHVLELARALDPTVTLAAVVRSQGSAQRLVDSGVPAYRGLEESIPALRTDYGEFDVVMDFTGSADAPRQAVKLLKSGGRFILGSVVDGPLDLGASMRVLTRELDIRGTASSSLSDLQAVARMTSDGTLDLAKSVTHRVPLEEVGSALGMLEHPPPGMVRIVLDVDTP